MKAAFLHYKEANERTEELLHFENNATIPEIKDDEILVRVKTCALDSVDVLTRKGQFNRLLGKGIGQDRDNDHSVVIGYHVSGICERVGRDVDKLGKFKAGDEVVGICPLTGHGGCAEYTAQKHFNFVLKPLSLSHEEAAASLASGVRAYTALYFHMHLVAGESILVIDGAHSDGYAAIQLAAIWGARIFTTATTMQEFNFLQDKDSICKVIDVSSENVVDVIMQETGGLGVDLVYDSFKNISSQGSKNAVTKYQIFNMLAVHGRWATVDNAMQVDPPDSALLLLKGISLSYVFPQNWVLSNSQQGRFLHILTDLMDKVSKGEIKVKISSSFPLEKIREAHRTLEACMSPGTVLIKP